MHMKLFSYLILIMGFINTVYPFSISLHHKMMVVKSLTFSYFKVASSILSQVENNKA